MSIRYELRRITDTGYGASYIYDNPKQCAIYNFATFRFILADGFSMYAPGAIVLPAGGLMLWYRFNDRGMLFGYVVNTGNTQITIPNSEYIYYEIRTFNFTGFQFKFYLSCLTYELYNNNNHLPLFYDYTKASDEMAIKRMQTLSELETIQLKGFKELSVASFILLPYTQFNTYKFDFHHTAYNEDGSLKSGKYIYPSMFASGGSLKPQYYPQPTKLET